MVDQQPTGVGLPSVRRVLSRWKTHGSPWNEPTTGKEVRHEYEASMDLLLVPNPAGPLRVEVLITYPTFETGSPGDRPDTTREARGTTLVSVLVQERSNKRAHVAVNYTIDGKPTRHSTSV